MTVEIQPPLDQQSAEKIKQEVDSLLTQISGHELRLASSYARLGGLLRAVKVNQFWGSYGFDRFSSYLESVREKIDRRRSQLYAILSVAETLLPHLTEEQLETIGITKAHELRRLVNEGGNLSAYVEVDPELLPQLGMDQLFSQKGEAVNLTAVRLMDFAANPKTTAIKLRAAVNNILHVKEGPQGNWLDLGGFYALPDEKKEIEAFWELGRRVLQIGAEESEHEAKKQVMLAAARECQSSWVQDLGYGHN